MMNSSSKLEAFMNVVGTGSTGIGLLQDYAIRTSELNYFIDYVKKTPVAKLSLQALAPNDEMDRVAERVKQAYEGVMEEIPRIEKNDPSTEDMSAMKDRIEYLYTLLQGIYTTIKSGRTVM